MFAVHAHDAPGFAHYYAVFFFCFLRMQFDAAVALRADSLPTLQNAALSCAKLARVTENAEQRSALFKRSSDMYA